MPRLIIPFAALMSICIFVLWQSSEVSSAQENDPGNPDRPQISALMKERIETLRLYSDECEERYHHGIGSLAEVLAAQNMLTEAKLVLTENHELRLKFLKILVDNMKAIEARIKELHEVGAKGGSRSQLYLATASRLKAEIDYAKQQLRK